jgi:hypothetical protein
VDSGLVYANESSPVKTFSAVQFPGQDVEDEDDKARRTDGMEHTWGDGLLVTRPEPPPQWWFRGHDSSTAPSVTAVDPNAVGHPVVPAQAHQRVAQQLPAD